MIDEQKPVAYGYWSERLGWYGCSLQPGGSYAEPDRRPLYPQAAIDAAVAKAAADERERCAQIAETPFTGEQDDITMNAKDRIARAIRAT